MATKKNKDGFMPGELVDHKTHNNWLIKKRQEEKKAATQALLKESVIKAEL